MKDAVKQIILSAINDSLPYDNTKKLLENLKITDDITVFSIGKAAVPMAQAAADVLCDRIKTGLLVTKYGHTGEFSSPYFDVIEASHPISDKNSIKAAEKAIEIAEKLSKDDTVIILLSGGGSALFEKSTVSPEIQRDVTEKLLSRGAAIGEINAVRKRLSLVKGGKFASACYPAKVITVALSDVLDNDRSVIASGISVKDTASDEFVKAVADKYLYDADRSITDALFRKTDIEISDGGYYFAGDINSLCNGAVKQAEKLGFKPVVITKCLQGEARDCAEAIIKESEKYPSGTALIYCGETTVTLRGNGKGGRNQEMALTASILLKGRENIVFASAGSDGTDGPTDAAGGIADGYTYNKMLESGLNPEKELKNNNSYFALKSADALLVTGPTGTNVNDITILIKQ